MKNIYLTSVILISLITAGYFALNITQETAPSHFQNELVYRNGPEHFAAIHNLIRTQEGQERPQYQHGDRQREFEKAKKQIRSGAESLDWIERGPSNAGGRTRGLIVDPDDETARTWFAASVGGGIWRTTDAGDSWELLTEELTNMATSTIAMSPANTNVIYAGTGEGIFSLPAIEGSGMWKSEDKGESWRLLPATDIDKRFTNFTRIVVNPDDENEVIVSTVGSEIFEGARTSYILKSTDGGENWDEVFASGSQVQQIIHFPEQFDTLYAAVRRDGVYRSVDGGESWQFVLSVFDFGDISRIELAISPNNPDVIYVSCQDFDTGSRLIYTHDGFETAASTVFEGPQADWLRNQGWYDNTIAVHPYNDSIVWVAGQGTMLQIDLGSEIREITLFDEFENETDFLIPIDNSALPIEVEDGGGLGADITDGLPVNTELEVEDLINIEVRFGPGVSSMAHLIDVDVFSYEFTFNTMVEVPFQAWDTTNNRQLATSVFDIDTDGQWSFEDYASAPFALHDIQFVHITPYSDTANPEIALNPVYKALYYWALGKEPGFDGSIDSLPEAKLLYDTKQEEGLVSDFRPIADGYGQYIDVEDVGSKGVHVDHHNIIFIPRDSATQSFYVLNANDGGVAFSNDNGTTFRQTGSTFSNGGTFATSEGYNVSQFYGIDKRNGLDQFVGGTQDNGSWVSDIDPDATSAWREAPSGDGFEAAWNYDNTDLVLETSQFNGIWKSYNAGISWTRLQLPVSDGPFVTRVASSQLDADLIFMCSDSGLVRSEDFGESWTVTLMPSVWNFHRSWGPPTRIGLADPAIVWSGSGMGSGNSVCVSEDRGLKFRSTVNYNLADRGSVTGITTHPTERETAYVLFSQADGPKILRTENLGQNWEDISGFVSNVDESSNGFPDVAVYSLLVMPFDVNRIWAGTEIGIFESMDNGETWQYADNGLPPVAIWEMKIVNDQIVLATHGRGIWTLNTSELLPVSTEKIQKQDISMKVGPNPTSDLIRLNYTLEQARDIDISIFSLDGKLTQNAFRSREGVGPHQIEINISQFTPGMYMLRMQVDQQVISEKIVIE